MYDFGLRMRELRNKRGLSQRKAAKLLNVSNSAVSGYEGNIRTPSLEVLTQIALLYNVSTDYLLGLENRKMIGVDNLTSRQMDIINSLLTEFKASAQPALKRQS